jgi:hypothetical protein
MAALVHRLGGEACLFPVAADSEGALTEVGRLGGLPVWSTDAPAGVARKLARRLARHGSLGLLLAHQAERGTLAVAATVEPVRLVAVPLHQAEPLALQRLARAARALRATPLEMAIACAEALDLDAAGRQVFAVLHRLLLQAVESLPSRVPRDDRHAWALAQITRLLFLRFVESEGWLDGNPRFLAEKFDACLTAGRDPTRHLLQPLFFGTLNRDVARRSRFARAFGAIPFLNGGLFEPTAVERTYQLRLTAEYWRDAFAALVDRVDVTLDPDGGDGRVTPELLGRAFEGVMDTDERKREGAFFTPPALVDEVLRAALACHLAPLLHRTETAIAAALDDPDPLLRRALLDVTVLDPAAGSGAFLVGALALLHGPGPRQPARIRHLVSHRLFGVDRHPGAVRLTELRLWLEVLRAMRGSAPSALPPLPNLDAIVRAGDALVDPLFGCSIPSAMARELGAQHAAVRRLHGVDKRAALAALRRGERVAILAAMARREEALSRRILEVLERGRSPTLFGDRPGIDAAARHDLRVLQAERHDLRRERRRITRDAAAAPFALETAFAATLARRGGFDLVVGNPPWVRAERIPPATRRVLAARYRWWRGSEGRGWRHLPDLAVAFAERSFGLLAPGGTLALLVPAKLATVDYGAACRAGLTSRATLHRVADLADDPSAGFEATTYPLAVIASRRVPPDGHAVRLGLAANAPAQSQAAWRAAGRWMLAPPAVQRVAARIAAEHPPLRAMFEPRLGIKTGVNAAFLDPPDTLRAWCRPALRGRDIRPFLATPSSWLLWPAQADGTPWDTLPAPLYQHLMQYAAALQRRADQHSGPWWQLFRTRGAVASHRVVWSDIATRLAATVVPDNATVPLNSCYVMALPSRHAAEAVTAWLNSTWIGALARLTAEPAAGNCARFAARAIGGVPLPSGVPGNATLAAFTHAAADRDVVAALDDCVADYLGLDRNDRALLQPFAMRSA